MATFMQTMFVATSPPRPSAAKPLHPIQTNVLAEPAWPESPQSIYQSPLQKHFRDVLEHAPTSPASPRSRANKHEDTSQIPNPPCIFNASTASPRRYVGRGGAGDGDWFHGHDGFDVETDGKADLFTLRSNSNARTRAAFKPARTQKGTNSWQLKQFAEATLGSGSLRKVVKLPEGEDRDEWLAVNVVDFYNQINLLYGAITEFCSPQSCPEMKATEEFEYLWHAPPAFPKPTRLPAPTYISHLLTWVSSLISDNTLFPTSPGVPFPPAFQSTIKQIFKRLYRIYAHIYCHHYGVIRGLGLEAHLNTGFKHYVLFVEEFGLADEGKGRKAEWYGPLGELVESMLKSD